jgi:hypothetical protein
VQSFQFHRRESPPFNYLFPMWSVEAFLHTTAVAMLTLYYRPPRQISLSFYGESSGEASNIFSVYDRGSEIDFPSLIVIFFLSVGHV